MADLAIDNNFPQMGHRKSVSWYTGLLMLTTL